MNVFDHRIDHDGADAGDGNDYIDCFVVFINSKKKILTGVEVNLYKQGFFLDMLRSPYLPIQDGQKNLS